MSAEHYRNVLARGAGRSYGDAALNAGGRIIATRQLRSVHSFDEQTGEVVVDSGATFGDLLDRYALHGWIPPVTPGTQFVTIGGAVANDVHGKNHDFDGSFGDHVLWLDLVFPDGSERRVEPSSDPEVFAATIGGVGLTGVVTRVAFRMKRVPSTMLRVREQRVANFDDYLRLFQEGRTRYRYSVGWVDGLAKGANLGRGILETAEHVEHEIAPAKRRRVRLPIDLPSGLINASSVALFNSLYYHRIARRGRERMLDLERFFYPLDSLLDWNRMYGRAGFFQFQCVVPDAVAANVLPHMLETVSRSRLASFVNVLKTLGRSGRGFLSFPMKGVTLALDFPRRAGVAELLQRLHDMVADCGGRVYLAKDACLRADQFRPMYPGLRAMQDVLTRIDPHRKMRSDLASRLGI